MPASSSSQSTASPRVVAFGELMLGLSPPGFQRLVQAETFIARYTGAEANVAVSLAHFGVETFAVSKVPAHEIGQAAINYLRRFGVRTDFIVRGGQRLGLFYVETGAGQRPSQVVYDRAASSLCEVRPDEFDWDAILDGKHWFHFCGTAPALGQNVRHVLTDGLKVARRLGLTVSCDCNYRSKLWSADEAGRVLAALFEHVDVLVCGREDTTKLFGLQDGSQSDDALADQMRQRFNLQSVAMTARQGVSASVNRFSALMCRDDGVFHSRQYEVEIVDRIGAGDAFDAGLIYGLLSGLPPQRVVDFAVAASCLKHTIPGDFNLVSREEVEQLLAGDQSGRVQR